MKQHLNFNETDMVNVNSAVIKKNIFIMLMKILSDSGEVNLKLSFGNYTFFLLQEGSVVLVTRRKCSCHR